MDHRNIFSLDEEQNNTMKPDPSIEEILRQITLLPDKQEQEVIIRKLVSRPDEVIETLFELLSRNEPALLQMALQVVQTIGYPQNEAALPALLWLVAYGKDPLDEQALQIFVQMGPSILPQLLHMAEEDPDWDRWLEDALGVASNVFHEHIGRRDQHELRVQKLISTLITSPEKVVPALIYVLKKNIRDWTELAPVILEALGYPHNKAAIPVVLWYAATTFNAATDPAFRFLKSLPLEALIAQFIQLLWNGEKEYGNWSLHLWEICLVLRTFPMSLVQCGPTLVYLLSQMTWSGDDKDHTKKYLLQDLEQIGPLCAEYALPTLIAVLQREGTNELGQQVQRLIASFDPAVLEPYWDLLTTIIMYDKQ